MTIVIFSDVHGNLPALEALIMATRANATQYICLGDIINYAPWGNECAELIDALPNRVVLQGNHERLFLGEESIDSESLLVQKFFHVASSFFTRYDLLRNLPEVYTLDDFICIHTIDHQRIYADTEITIDHDYIIGHTHHAFVVTRSSHQLINVGSVGQNRGFINICSYALYHPDRKTVELCEQPYDHGVVVQALKDHNYPPECIAYYANKAVKL